MGGIANLLTVALGPQLQFKHLSAPFCCVPFSGRTAQTQCCLGSLKENRCLAGINAAKKDAVCEEDSSDKCPTDSYKASINDHIPRHGPSRV